MNSKIKKLLKSYDYKRLIVPIAGTVLLLLFMLMFIINSLVLVSETNKNNFAYTITIRNAIEELDRIVERAVTNVEVLSDCIRDTFEIKQLGNEKYDLGYLSEGEVYLKGILKDTPGVSGVWFQMNPELPFSEKAYSWFVINDKNQVINKKQDLINKGIKIKKVNPKDDKVYYEAIKNKQLTWSDIYTDTYTRTPMISICQPIFKNNKLIGVVGVDISVKNLQHALKEMQNMTGDTSVILVDQNNNIILKQLAPDSLGLEIDSKIIKKFKTFEGQDAMIDYYNNGIRKTAIMLPLSNKYHVIIALKNKQIFKGFDRLFRTIYLLFTILIIFTFFNFVNYCRSKRLSKEFKEQAIKLRSVIDASPNIVLVKNNDGIYIDCNILSSTFFGTKNTVVGKSDYDIFSKEQADEILKNDEIVYKTKKILIREGTYPDKNGKQCCIEKYIVPLLDSEGNITSLLIIGFDITKRKEAEKALKKAKVSAEKATLMKSNFLANMSHEIRTPLNGILGFLQLLRDTRTTEEQSEYINDAEISSSILLGIINDILDFSKIEAGKLKLENISFNISSLVEDIAIVESSNADKKGLVVNTLICSDVPFRVFGDPGRVKQILCNIVSNALKFTKEGEIFIYVSHYQQDEDTSLISFIVKDSGIGIPEDKLKLIFNEFTQADPSTTRKYGGTGLGLAITKQLTHLMNGEITVESCVNEGSIFTVSIPFKIDKTENEKIADVLNTISGSTILVYDNNITDVRIIKYYLSQSNCIVLEAKNINECIDILENNEISLALIDYTTQHNCIVNDKEKALRLVIRENEKTKDIPVVLCSSISQIKETIAQTHNGYNAYLKKPFKKAELMETIENLIKNQNKNMKNDFVSNNSNMLNNFNKKAKILVVEDSELNYKLIFKILKKQGLNCELVLNGRDAIDTYKENKYDLILMDCQMPILDGYAATREIRKIEAELNKTHVPIIAMTANAMAQDDEKCFNAGMDDYISKPFKIEDLINILKKYLKVEIGDILKEETFESKLSQITEELGLSKEEAIELWSEFITILPNIIQKLKTALDGDYFEEVSKIAHKLKGSSANLRLDSLPEISKKLQEASNNHDKEKCIELINKIKENEDYLKNVFIQYAV